MSTEADCIFCKIVRGEIPARKVYEDEDVLAFHDIHPAAPVHVLVIPKKHIATLAEATAEDQAVLGKMMLVATQVAHACGSTEGFRTIINVGRIGRQDIYHLHMHVLGGPQPLGRMIQAN
jgi:Diadenosine tetraphosphate (Ap4A) hydrolase and other HIT family hydrolases